MLTNQNSVILEFNLFVASPKILICMLELDLPRYHVYLQF